MNRLNKLLCTVACALPLVAFGQTSTSPNVKAPDEPRTQLEKDRTTKNGQASQYGGPGTDAADTTSKDTSKAMKRKDRKAAKSDVGAPIGSVSSYPAPTRDGTPTSPSTTK